MRFAHQPATFCFSCKTPVWNSFLSQKLTALVEKKSRCIERDQDLGEQRLDIGLTALRSNDVADLPLAKQGMLQRLHSSDEDLLRRTVLLVDDDTRNIFALSSVLERRGMEVLTATTGSEALAVLKSRSDVAIVLMDIMMPGMDGYETIQAIRAQPKFRRLPILALTAKAMKGDREKCLEAGASDYLAKPVNTEQLLSALRMWLHR